MNEDAAIMYLKSVLFDLPPDHRAKVEAAKAAIESAVQEHGDAGLLALGWVAAEAAQKDA